MVESKATTLVEHQNFSTPIQNILRYCEQFPEWDSETSSLPNKEGARAFVLQPNTSADSLHIGLRARFGNDIRYSFAASYLVDRKQLTTNVIRIELFPDEDFMVTYNFQNSYGHSKSYEYTKANQAKAVLLKEKPYFLWNGVPTDDLRPLLSEQRTAPKKIDLQQTGILFLGHLFTRNYETPQVISAEKSFGQKANETGREILWMSKR